MNQAHTRRIQNETTMIIKTASEYNDMFTITMVNDNMYHWNVLLKGPQESIYEGYIFHIDITLSLDYPNRPPQVKFITPIQHLNINNSGNICLDILKDNWSSAQNIISILKSVRLLLSYPNPDDPFNPELAKLYRENYDGYIQKIKQECENCKFKN